MIRKITIKQALPIRKEAMYPDKPLDYCSVEGDDFALHYGYFKDDMCVACISSFSGTPNQLRKFACLPEYQGQGIGSELLSTLLRITEKPIKLNARVEKSTFYQKFGFVETTTTFHSHGYDYCVMILE